MTVALVALATLLLVALVGLLLPVRLDLALGNAGVGAQVARLRWAGVGVDLAARSAKTPGPRAASTPGKRRRRAWRLPRATRVLDLLERAPALLRRLLRATHPRGLRLRLRWGLDDPGQTGQWVGLLAPVTAPLTARLGPALSVEPSFEGPELSWSVHGRFWLIPAEVLLVAVGFLLSPAMLRLLFDLSRGRR